MCNARVGVIACLLFSLFPLASVEAAPGPVGVRRWAILTSTRLQADHLPDLLEAAFTGIDGIQLIERKELQRISDEQTLQALAPDNTAARVKLGRLLKADILLLVNHELIERHEIGDPNIQASRQNPCGAERQSKGEER